MKLLICDDERPILNGLQKILDWTNLGFNKVFTATKGDLALNIILNEEPNLVLIDINMPILNGLDVVRFAREKGFEGDFIIISGFSDFSYAQTAISFNVTSYLCKPIDDDELLFTVKDIIKKIEARSYNNSLISIYENIAVKEYLYKVLDYYDSTLENFSLKKDEYYQVLAYENFYQKDFTTTDTFKDMLQVSNKIKYASLRKEQLNLIVLIGEESINLVGRSIKYYTEAFQKNSKLDSVFLYFGESVYSIENLCFSYNSIKALMKKRFFCAENQHFLYTSHLDEKVLKNTVKLESIEYYADSLFNGIKLSDSKKIMKVLLNISKGIRSNNFNEKETKEFFTNIFLLTKNKVNMYYKDIPLLTSSFTHITTDIDNKMFLYEIITYIHNQLIVVINTINLHSKDYITYEIVDYIDKNFYKNLKLKNVAEHFNYNSSYFGKLFNKIFNCSFNKYLELIRIEKSKEFLKRENLKVYEVCENVGYNNVDYFHKKFKSIVGVSPLEYRKEFFNKYKK